MGCWHDYLSGATCRLAYGSAMPLPLTVSCFSKIQIGFTFSVPADLGSPGKRAVKQVFFVGWQASLATYQLSAVKNNSRCNDELFTEIVGSSVPSCNLYHHCGVVDIVEEVRGGGMWGGGIDHCHGSCYCSCCRPRHVHHSRHLGTHAHPSIPLLQRSVDSHWLLAGICVFMQEALCDLESRIRDPTAI